MGPRRSIIMIVVTASVVTPAGSAVSAAELPPPEELIEAALASHSDWKKAEGEDNELVLGTIAQAKTYLGKYDEAVEMGRPLGEFFRPVILTLCVKAQAETTGRAPAMPAGFSEDECWMARLELVKFHVGRGEFEPALKQLAAVTRDRVTASPIAEGYVAVADVQLAAGRKDAALALFRKVIGVANDISFAPQANEHLLSVVKGTLGGGDRRLARKAADLMNCSAAAYERRDTMTSHFHVEAWSRAGRAWQLVGDDDVARIAFRRAAELIERIGEAEAADPDEVAWAWNQRVDAWTQLAVQQFSAGFRADAEVSFSKARRCAKQVKHWASNRDFRLANIIQARFEAGDEAGAREGLREISSPYFQASCLLTVAESEFQQKRTTQAQSDLKRVIDLTESILDNDGRAHLTIKIAEAHSTCGNLSAARKAFASVLSLSNESEDRKFHQWIAFAQIRCGLLEHAYQTIQEIPRPEYRAMPLAILAAKAARTKAEQQRKATSTRNGNGKR